MARHRFHGAQDRFEIIAAYIDQKYRGKVVYIADVAGGQGLLARLLNKRGFIAEVIDPRGWTMVGVKNRQEDYHADMADYYDLIVGLHPDEALIPVVKSAKIRPTIVIPCCNFWDKERKLGRDALLDEIEGHFRENNIVYERQVFNFAGPQNIGFTTIPAIFNPRTKT